MMKRHFTFSIILLCAFLHSACTDSRTSDDENTHREVAPNSLYAQSTESLNNQISSSRKNAITQAVQTASPAVVGINVTEIRKYRYRDPLSMFWENDPFWGQFMNPQGRTFQQEVKGLGSGFLISSDGYILTNSHVAGNATRIVVTLTDGTRHDAKLVGADDLTDIALLKIDGEDFPYLKFGDSNDIMVGEWAIALGNPFGLFDINDKPSVTVGVVSAAGLNFPDVDGRSYRDMIQTDAAINSGNSGGPLLNAAAEVVGMNTFIYTGGGKGSIGIGFAVPVNKLKVIYDELRRNGKVDRSFKTGITVQPIDMRLAKAFGLSAIKGVLVSDIQAGSSGEKAGLKPGDVIVEANDEEIKNEQDLSWAIRELKAGDKLKLKVIRNKELKTILVMLEKAN
ncbi:2-alkenal reductase [Chloroherpeton thalassium ATCC 35110]|uniref:2-alkenal reductase n=1 Tax=Chloroherpeton thalassium (strain ATCC 35110 / GB-78) TaxID=517418 RepID=B3QX69_CHLT3|nr:trypsin-like peptidase domain-containing protein [Chloroherpeton thalassium]ACF14879.1 2-alkenal reductase [Chloroherpeton thalassium ATCC 35110]